MDFYIPSEAEQLKQQLFFRECLRQVYLAGAARGLIQSVVAGNSQSQLSRVLALEDKDNTSRPMRPEEHNLRLWCFVWIQHGIITAQQAEWLMNAAGYASPQQKEISQKVITGTLPHTPAVEVSALDTSQVSPEQSAIAQQHRNKNS